MNFGSGGNQEKTGVARHLERGSGRRQIGRRHPDEDVIAR